MQTNFTPLQLADPAMAASEAVIRKCVHCGFCTATCPTYVLLGDELDSPRGRIYLMKDMLENERAPTAEVVKHVDRCLSCLSCMTPCPSGVNYMHLVDHARAYIEARYRRPWRERLFRGLLAWVLPYPSRFRFVLKLARWTRPLAPVVNALPGFNPLAAMFALAPNAVPSPSPVTASSAQSSKGRVVMLQGCAEPVLKPEIRAAAVRLHAMPEKGVVPNLGRVVVDTAAGLADDVFERHGFKFCALLQVVQVHHIGVVVLAVVKLQRLLRIHGGQGVDGVRQGGKGVFHGVL